MFKAVFRAIGSVLAWLNPNAPTIQAALLKTVAGDIVRDYLFRNPKTIPHIASVDRMIDILRSVVPVKRTTAERIIRSTLYDLLVLAGETPDPSLLN